MAETLSLDLPLDYPVYVQRGVIDRLGPIVEKRASAHRYAVLSDTRVASFHGARLLDQLPADRTRLFTIPPGEHEKTRERWAELTDALLAWGAGRDTTVVALGGGVIGDLAGFVAATYMRGIPVVQVPTTVLAMVDASVGGKTAIDTPSGKNLVGAFHNPSAVIMDPALLETLPPADLRSGLAEMIKHGVIADASYFAAILHELPDIEARGAQAPAFASLIAGSVRIKAAVVAEDMRENGRRQTLNFGHTIAHAIERVLEYRILHGEAVAIGMVVEARLAKRLSIASSDLVIAIVDALARAGLPSHVPAGIDPNALLAATKGDKKNRAGSVRYSLPRGIGEMESAQGRWSVPISDDDVLAVLGAG